MCNTNKDYLYLFIATRGILCETHSTMEVYMTLLRDWFYHRRKEITMTQAAAQLGLNDKAFMMVVNGVRRPSIKLAKRLQAYTQDEIKWHDIMEYVDQPKGAIKKIDLNITNI